MRIIPIIVWTAVALLGAAAFAVLALSRGEGINAAWLLTAALCTYAIGYRFYSRIISHRIFALDDARPTPAVRLEDGHDYVPTNPWVVFGHHFAAIAGAGPLVGPVLAAQFGFLPGTIWIIVGVVLGGAVQDFVILCGSLRRDGASLGAMARAEIGPVAGWVARFAILAIIIILIAVLAMVVVGIAAKSPWTTATLGLTIPIALLMGVWMRWLRPGRVLEASAIGMVLLALALVAGRWAADSATVAPLLTLSPVAVSWSLIIYGFFAAVLPVWLLLAPRDYLSSFVKVGAVGLLGLGIFCVLPTLQMPAYNHLFDDGAIWAGGKGPVFPGKLFPFAFITIACGAISGFHALVSSGTTPKLLAKETQARPIGYGAMLMESLVAVMAMIAACSLTPGLYFAVSSPAAVIGPDAASAAATITKWGFAISPDDLTAAAAAVGEPSILSRQGGAPCLALGMAGIFDGLTRFLGMPGLKALWYHFATLFEALFILTTIDAGTRVARFILQDLLGRFHAPLGRVAWLPGTWLSSAVVVAGWGWFLLAGVTDKNGGIYVLWPLFGIANQLLAAVALSVATVIIVRMGKAKFAWITVLPLAWLLTVTLDAGWQKLDPDSPVSFTTAIAKQHAILAQPDVTATAAGAAHIALVNATIDAVLCAVFMAVIVIIVLDAARACLMHRPGRADDVPAGANPA
jgi:carbon starvation protein